MNSVPIDIINKAPRCMISHFYCDNSVCTNFYTICTSTVVSEDEYKWSVRLQCRICNKVWWLCNECALRKKLLLSSQLLNHQYRNHVDSKATSTKRTRIDDASSRIDASNPNNYNSNSNEYIETKCVDIPTDVFIEGNKHGDKKNGIDIRRYC